MSRTLPALSLPPLKFRPESDAAQRAGVEKLYGALARSADADPASRLVRTDSFYGARAMDAATQGITFIAATEGVKRDGSILRIDGCDLTNLEANPRFMYAHQYVQLPVGNIVAARKVDHISLGRVLEMDVVPLRAEGDDEWLKFSRLLFRMYRVNDIDAVSLGWYVINAVMRVDENGYYQGWDFLESDVLELSACSIPVDPNALQAAITRTCESHEERQLLLDGLVVGRSNRFRRDGVERRADPAYVLREIPGQLALGAEPVAAEPEGRTAPEPEPAPAPEPPADPPGAPEATRSTPPEGEGATPVAAASEEPPAAPAEVVAADALVDEVRALRAEVAEMREHGVVTRVGKVLSARNRERLTSAVTALRDAADAVEAVVRDADAAAEKAKEEEDAARAASADDLTARAAEVLGPLADRFEARTQERLYDSILGGLERTQEVLSRAPRSPEPPVA